MIINKEDTQNPQVGIKIEGIDLETVQNYNYIGHTITSDGKYTTEINKRIGMAKSNFNDMKDILTSKQITPGLKLRIAKSYIFSIFLYGAETWTLDKKTEQRIEAFEMWIYRRIGRIGWKEKKTNDELLKRLKMNRELLNTIRTRQMRFLGHVKRHNSLLKVILEGKIQGKRGRGRPRLTWTSNIKRWTNQPMKTCTIKASDRVE